MCEHCKICHGLECAGGTDLDTDAYCDNRSPSSSHQVSRGGSKKAVIRDHSQHVKMEESMSRSCGQPESVLLVTATSYASHQSGTSDRTQEPARHMCQCPWL